MAIYPYSEEKMIRELPIKENIDPSSDWIIVEGKDGTKRTLVEQVISKSLRDSLFYDSLQDMINATNIVEDSIVYTRGFSVPGDGGGSKYEIVYAPGEVPDGYTSIRLNNRDTLRAHLSTENVVVPEQFGAIGDGINDDTDAINRILNTDYPININSNQKYRVTNNITIPTGKFIDFKGATLILDDCRLLIENVADVSIHNINISATGDSKTAFYINKSSRISITNSNIIGVKNNESAISIKDSDHIYINNIKFRNEVYGGDGIYISGSSTFTDKPLTDAIFIENCTFHNMYNAIYTGGLIELGTITVDNISCYYSDNTNINCVAISINNSKGIIYLNNVSVYNGRNAMNIGAGCEGYISLGNTNIKNTYNCFTLNGTKNCKVVFHGNHKYLVDDDYELSSRVVCKMLNCTLYNKAAITNIGYNMLTAGYLNTGIVRNDYSPSMILDMTDKDISENNGNLVIDDFRNMCVNIKGYDLLNISSGIQGQVIELFSSEDRKLRSISTNLELLEDNDITLHKYKGVELVYYDGKWIQK